ncbi:hypothetical protein KUH03_01785 [Sphingobacterium sp. E70]|nr:hypothetical protein KUH03_01785 [Sphingobacterium sp. E70]
MPQNPIDFTHTLMPNDYYNLVYACGYCNGAKTNKWPTKDINKSNDGKVGFIDPTDPVYDTLFYRNSDGSISLLKKSHHVSNYIFKEINLCNPVHSILWKLERIDFAIETLKQIGDSSLDTNLKADLSDLHEEYRNLVNELFN